MLTKPALTTLIFLSLAAYAATQGQSWPDCSDADSQKGPYDSAFLNTTWNGSMYYGLYPKVSAEQKSRFGEGYGDN
jgi:hypothetical protein